MMIFPPFQSLVALPNEEILGGIGLDQSGLGPRVQALFCGLLGAYRTPAGLTKLRTTDEALSAE